MSPPSQDTPTPRARGTRGASILRWAPIVAYLGVQALVIGQAVSPATDSARYFRAALAMRARPDLEVLREIEDHPGFPWLLGQALAVAEALGVRSPRGQVLVGHVLSSAAGLALLLVALRLGTRLVGPRAAQAGALCLALLPRPAWQMADILSDSLHAALWLGSLALGASAVQRPSALRVASAGALGALAYCVRAEAVGLVLGVSLAAALLLLGPRGARPARRSVALGWALYTLCFFAGPLALRLGLGAWSVKPSLRRALGVGLEGAFHGAGASPFLASASASPEWAGQAAGALVAVLGRLGQEVQQLHLATGVLGGWFALRLARRAPAGILVACVLAAHLSGVLFACLRLGYVSERYLLPLAPLLTMVGAWGLLEAARGLRPANGPLARLLSPRGAVCALLLASIAVSVPSLTARRLHPNDHGIIAAGQWLAGRIQAGETVHDPRFFPTFLAGLAERASPTVAPRSSARAHYVIAESRDLEKLGLQGLEAAPGWARVAAFSRKEGGTDREAGVYRLLPAAGAAVEAPAEPGTGVGNDGSGGGEVR